MPKLPLHYYLNPDVVELSKDLIGKVLCTQVNGIYTSGIITETEAYRGLNDKASHAYGGRRTQRTNVMYAEGGTSYVYLCYGIHYLFNVVTNKAEIPEAILIRSIKPLDGIIIQNERRKVKNIDKNTFIGPGKVSKALGINLKLNNQSLLDDIVWIEDRGINISPNKIVVGKRVGIDYAEEDADLPYRFRYLGF